MAGWPVHSWFGEIEFDEYTQTCQTLPEPAMRATLAVDWFVTAESALHCHEPDGGLRTTWWLSQAEQPEPTLTDDPQIVVASTCTE